MSDSGCAGSWDSALEQEGLVVMTRRLSLTTVFRKEVVPWSACQDASPRPLCYKQMPAYKLFPFHAISWAGVD